MQTVAAALVIHPFMLSKWWKDTRDGKLQEKARKAPLTRGVHFSSARVLRRQPRRYILYYNLARMHPALEYHSPVVFEARAT